MQNNKEVKSIDEKYIRQLEAIGHEIDQESSLEEVDLEKIVRLRQEAVDINKERVEVLAQGSPADQAKAEAEKVIIEEAEECTRAMDKLEQLREDALAQLSDQLPIDTLKKYPDNLKQWAQEINSLFDILIVRHPTIKMFKNSKHFIERQLKEDQKTVIKVFLDKIFKQQIREQIENRVWSKGTPKVILAEMKLTAEEEARLVEFKDPITEEYIKYFVLVMMSSGKHYFDITTLYKLIKYTAHAETTDQEQYANIIEMSEAFQASLPSDTIAVRDAYSRKELTVKDFFEMDPDLPEKFYKIIDNIKKQRKVAYTSLEAVSDSNAFRLLS